jgi:GT2 family glycosyltransferase
MLSLFTQDFDPDQFETIFVNDGSTDRTTDLLTSLPASHRYRVETTEHRGAAAARNRGINVAQGEMIAFTDDDCVVPSNWLNHLDAFFRQKKATAVGGTVINGEPGNIYAALYSAVWDFFSERLNRDHKAPRFLVSNNFAIKREALLRVGNFNEGFVVGGEDRELIARLRAAGETVYYDPSLIVTHHHGFTFKTFLTHLYRMGRGSSLLHRLTTTNTSRSEERLRSREYIEMLFEIPKRRVTGSYLSDLLLLTLAQSAAVAGYITGSLSHHRPSTQGE